MTVNDRRGFLTLDQGGHASRAIVFSSGGDKLVEVSRPVDTYVHGNRVELDAKDLLRGLKDAATEAYRQLEQFGPIPILKTGLATQRSNIVCWNRINGEPLSPVLSWQDRRAPEFLTGLDEKTTHEMTGLFPNPHYGASKLAWCLNNLPEVKRAVDLKHLMFGPMASFLTSRLTGSAPLADPANASRTLLWNVHTRTWDKSLCRHFGIAPDLLPATSRSRDKFGSLRLQGREVPLTVVTGDLSAAAFVHGRPKRDTAYVTVGTGAFIQRLDTRPFIFEERLLNGLVWDDGKEVYYSLEGTVNGAASALNWFCEKYGLEARDIESDLARWCDEYETVPLFLNGISGLGSPFWRSKFDSRFTGGGNLKELAVAVVESIVFLLHINLLEMNAAIEAPRRILISGGLASVDGLCRRLADLTGLEVWRSGEQEGTARGLAYLLAGLPRRWDSRIERRFIPQMNDALKERFVRWRSSMESALNMP